MHTATKIPFMCSFSGICHGLSPNFHIHVSVSDLYIPTMDLQEICGPILGINKSLTDTCMWKLGLRPRNAQKRNT